MDKYFAISIVLDSFAKINPHEIVHFVNSGQNSQENGRKLNPRENFRSGRSQK